MGSTAVCARKSKGAREFFCQMPYRRGTEPAHGKLLQRGRATMFATEREAWSALEETLKQAAADGDEWPSKFHYTIIEVVDAS